MHAWPKEIKKLAKSLRKEGKSYRQIEKKTKVPYSTIALWLRAPKKAAKSVRRSQ